MIMWSSNKYFDINDCKSTKKSRSAASFLNERVTRAAVYPAKRTIIAENAIARCMSDPPQRSSLAARLAASSTPFFSFEFFPPKTRSGVENLAARIERMAQLSPAFVDVTWQAGGVTSELTMEICSRVLKYCGVEVVMHITCAGMTAEEIKVALARAKTAGVRNVLALRGDPPKGSTKWRVTEGGFAHAVDLVKFIRKEFGDYFGIAVGGYPEGHSGCGRDDPRYLRDIKYLFEKVDAGADFVMTQLFYDPCVFHAFVRDCRKAGISCPIIPGVMPIQSYRSFRKMADYFSTSVPDRVMRELEPIKGNDAAVKAFGVKYAVEMCTQLIQGGAPGVHIYTLNLERSACEIVTALAFEKSLRGCVAERYRGDRRACRIVPMRKSGQYFGQTGQRAT